MSMSLGGITEHGLRKEEKENTLWMRKKMQEKGRNERMCCQLSCYPLISWARVESVWGVARAKQTGPSHWGWPRAPCLAHPVSAAILSLAKNACSHS